MAWLFALIGLTTHIRTEYRGLTAIFTVRGNLARRSGALKLKQAFACAQSYGVSQIVVDLRGVRYCGNEGYVALLAGKRVILEGGGRVFLIGVAKLESIALVSKLAREFIVLPPEEYVLVQPLSLVSVPT